jgi:hypothetical protein
MGIWDIRDCTSPLSECQAPVHKGLVFGAPGASQHGEHQLVEPSSCGPCLGGWYVYCVLYCVAALGELPGVGVALGVALAVVLYQAVVL